MPNFPRIVTDCKRPLLPGNSTAKPCKPGKWCPVFGEAMADPQPSPAGTKTWVKFRRSARRLLPRDVSGAPHTVAGNRIARGVWTSPGRTDTEPSRPMRPRFVRAPAAAPHRGPLTRSVRSPRQRAPRALPSRPPAPPRPRARPRRARGRGTAPAPRPSEGAALRVAGVVARFVRRITPRARTGSVSTSTHGLGDSVSRCPTYSELFGGLTG